MFDSVLNVVLDWHYLSGFSLNSDSFTDDGLVLLGAVLHLSQIRLCRVVYYLCDSAFVLLLFQMLF